MNKRSRIITAVAALSLTAAYFLPVWQIDLVAPQYPEGLSMQIWLYQITGQVEIINGLNHYIGMKHIDAAMFPEFNFLVYIMGALILLGLLVALLGRRRLLFAYLLLLLADGTAAMVDFYRWGYDYGHNLDPTAAIQVPGFSYQPPLIGHKQLLNFDAYSYPASGGWVIAAAGLTFMGVWLVEWSRNRKKQKAPLTPTTNRNPMRTAIAVVLLSLGMSACQTGPQPFAYGKDGCHACKMTIMTGQFGGEVVTKKGKVFKFDDLHCLQEFLKKGEVPPGDIAQILTTDYNKDGTFVEVEQAYFVKGGSLHSPMNSNTASFATREAAEAASSQFGGALVRWSDL